MGPQAGGLATPRPPSMGTVLPDLPLTAWPPASFTPFITQPVQQFPCPLMLGLDRVEIGPAGRAEARECIPGLNSAQGTDTDRSRDIGIIRSTSPR